MGWRGVLGEITEDEEDASLSDGVESLNRAKFKHALGQGRVD